MRSSFVSALVSMTWLFACGSSSDSGNGSGDNPAGQPGVGTESGGGAGVGGVGGGGAGNTEPPPPPRNCASAVTPTGQVFYVAPNGSDSAAGSATAPWATINKAVETVPDGATILVKDGTYTGLVRLDRRFTTGITVRAETAYGAKLRNNGIVIRAYSGKQITLEGFDIAHTGAGASTLVVHIQADDLAARTSYITLRNNVIHDSYNNDIIKLNNGAEHVTIEGNAFYNQSGSDEHIDINSVRDCVVQDNIFFNDFAGSGRTNGNDTSAYVVVKDSNANDDGILGAQRIQIRRNVFLNWQGNSNYGFIQIGEDGTANFEASEIVVENNLLIGNSSVPMRSPFATQGVQGVVFRHNTVVGNFPGPNTAGFAARLYTAGDNQANQNIQFFNNIWSDPTGTMNRFSVSPTGETTTFTLRHNLYWNGGKPLPSGNGDVVNVSADPESVVADPGLADHAAIVVPRLNGTKFADGSTSLCQAFEKLVTYGSPPAGSKAIDAADAAQSPNHDILRRPRTGAKTDLGAVEVQ